MMAAFEALDGFKAIARLIANASIPLLFEETAQIAPHRRIIIR